MSIDRSAFQSNWEIESLIFSRYSEVKSVYIKHIFSYKSISFPKGFEKIEFSSSGFLHFLKHLKKFSDNSNFSIIDNENMLIASNYKENNFKNDCINFSPTNDICEKI